MFSRLAETYQVIDSAELRMHLFLPDTSPPEGGRGAIIFFFGGGWANGNVSQFFPQAEHLSNRGMVAACAEYRIASIHGTTPFESVADAREAVRWLRTQAARFSIDPRKIAAGGGSAGGHIAVCSALLSDPKNGEPASCVPDALVLFNPVLDTTARGFGRERFPTHRETEASPCHHVRAELPPTLLMHGTADIVAPYENAGRFARLMTGAGNFCRLVPYEGRGHGFFNRRNDNPASEEDFCDTLDQVSNFLEERGFLAPALPRNQPA